MVLQNDNEFSRHCLEFRQRLQQPAPMLIAMLSTAPPHAEQVSISIAKTRFRRCAQVIATRPCADASSERDTALAAHGAIHALGFGAPPQPDNAEQRRTQQG